MTADEPGRTALSARLALATGSVLFFWLVLEVPGQLEWIRYYHLGDRSSIFLAEEPWRNPTLVMDPDRIFRRLPGTHLLGQTKGDMAVWLELPGESHAFDVYYDAAGFRNRRPTHDAEIAIIGDSLIEAPLVSDDELLAAQLERALGRRVATFGHLGYGPQQELDVLREDALALDRRWIVWAFFEGNDLVDFSDFEQRRKRWPLERALKRSLAYSVTKVLGGASRQAAARERARARLVRARAPTAEGGQVEILLGPPPPELWDDRWNDLLAAAIDVLAVARRHSEERGASFLAVLVPTKERVYREIAGGSAAPEQSPFGAKFVAECRERGIAALDLTGPLRERARHELVYFVDDAHWNGAGIGVAATEVAAAIRAHEASDPPMDTPDAP
jgi:hypothetical protein